MRHRCPCCNTTWSKVARTSGLLLFVLLISPLAAAAPPLPPRDPLTLKPPARAKALGGALRSPRVKLKVQVPKPETGTVQVPADHFGGKAKRALHYERFRRPGVDGRPAVFLHGGPGAPMPMAMILQSAFGEVMLSHFDIVYFDQRGAGRSLTAAEKDRRQVIRDRRHYTTRQYVADMELLRRELFGGRKITVIGSSWGGFYGLAYALAHPEAVEALLLGSFAASGRYAAEFCSTFDRVTLEAEARDAGLRGALRELRQAIGRGAIVWRSGTSKARPLREADLIEILMPLMVKARHQELTALLQLLVKNDPQGTKFLDGLDLEHGETASMGGSLPGEATGCQAFLDRATLLALEREPPAAIYCDNRAVAMVFRKICQPYFDRRELYNTEKDLARVQVPALIFAGRWDPILAWQETLRVALRMPRATFVLVDGGHTPIQAGGDCLARAIEAFIAGQKMALDCFAGHWP